MFKRVEKRRKKKEEEEELGLDEDMKEVLGMQDTDSDESDSDSDPSLTDQGAEDSTGELPEAENEGEDQSEEDDDKEEGPTVTVQEALQDPVYLVSIQPDVKACIVCPGKLLKGARMVQLHRKSNAHTRRVNEFNKLATAADPTDNAWEILQRNSEDKPKLSMLEPSGTSKRAQKKQAKLAAYKLRREKQKTKEARAKGAKVAAATASDSVQETMSIPPDSTKPLKKKRKVEPTAASTDASPKGSSLAPPSEQDVEAPTVKSIVRSASDRAKVARSRALKASKVGKLPPEGKTQKRREFLKKADW